MSLDFLDNKSILITGGSGSFGQSCVKYLLENSKARRIIIFSRDEHKHSQMQQKFIDHQGRLRFFIGDVRDTERLERAFNGVDYVIHAAALKQVHLTEYNPMEAIKTNILGTQNVINAALDREVKKVLLISTDKAANPANLYGATKLCAERLIVNANAYSGEGCAHFSAVRYGNVVGSRGSLVEIIRNQQSSLEVTVTHAEMTRFWITLDGAVEFVLRSLERMQGGEIFIPKMPSMKIVDFVRILAPDCQQKIVGIRPGEKIHEVLITVEEARRTKDSGDYYTILPEYVWREEGSHYPEGKYLGEDFYFASNNNEQWLEKEDAEKWLTFL